MDRKNTPSEQPSTSSGYSSEASNRRPYMDKIDRIVQKFLKEGDEYVELGGTLSNEVIQSSIGRLDSTLNNIKIANLPEDYKYFLNKYGSIYGSGIDMCGTAPEDDEEERSRFMASVQRGFKNSLRRYSDIEKVAIRSLWLIADIDESPRKFYIDTSGEGEEKGRIYMLDQPTKQSIYYAKNFTEFLGQLFIIFDETKDQ